MSGLKGDAADAELDKNSKARASMARRDWLLERLWGIASVALLLLALTTGMGLLARHHWLAELCANLRNQQVIALAGLLLIVIFCRRWHWLALPVVLLQPIPCLRSELAVLRIAMSTCGVWPPT